MLWPSVRRPGWLRMNSQTLPRGRPPPLSRSLPHLKPRARCTRPKRQRRGCRRRPPRPLQSHERGARRDHHRRAAERHLRPGGKTGKELTAVQPVICRRPTCLTQTWPGSKKTPFGRLSPTALPSIGQKVRLVEAPKVLVGMLRGRDLPGIEELRLKCRRNYQPRCLESSHTFNLMRQASLKKWFQSQLAYQPVKVIHMDAEALGGLRVITRRVPQG
jgi:hypothetical protein